MPDGRLFHLFHGCTEAALREKRDRIRGSGASVLILEVVVTPQRLRPVRSHIGALDHGRQAGKPLALVTRKRQATIGKNIPAR
jgi:hypothetical protein